jgi:hypothetical protein
VADAEDRTFPVPARWTCCTPSAGALPGRPVVDGAVLLEAGLGWALAARRPDGPGRLGELRGALRDVDEGDGFEHFGPPLVFPVIRTLVVTKFCCG